MNIRKAQIADLNSIVEIYNNTIPSRLVTADTEPVSVESRIEWFNSFTECRPLWIAEKDNKIIGWMSFKSFYGRPAYDGSVEIAIYIHEEHRSEGLGQEFIQLAIQEAQNLKIHTLLAFIFEHNEPSIRFFKKHGFTNYGILPEVALMDGKKFSLGIYGLKT